MLLLAKDCEDAWSFSPFPAWQPVLATRTRCVLWSLCWVAQIFPVKLHLELVCLHCSASEILSFPFPGGLFCQGEEKEGRKDRGKLAKQQQRRQAKAQHAPWGAAALLCMQQRGQAAPAAVRFCTLWNTYMHTNELQRTCWPRKPNPVRLLSPYYSMKPKLAFHFWTVVCIAVQVLFHMRYTHHPTSLIPRPCPTLALVSSLHERPGHGFPLLSAVNAAVLVGKKRCKAGTRTAVRG